MAATAVRGHHRRKERSAAYFFAGPGLERDIAFTPGTPSAGLVCLAVFGFRFEPFGLVFFGMIPSCLGASAEPIARIGYVDRGVAYRATAATAMRGHRRRKNGRSTCDARQVRVHREWDPVGRLRRENAIGILFDLVHILVLSFRRRRMPCCNQLINDRVRACQTDVMHVGIERHRLGGDNTLDGS